MRTRSLLVALAAGAIAVGLAAVPAEAQTGTLRGRIVDEAGRPVADAEITLTFVGNVERTLTLKSDNRGEFIQVGALSGRWTLTVKKGELGARLEGLVVRTNQTTQVPDLTIAPAGEGGIRTIVTAEEAERLKARNAELEAMFTEAGKLIDAGKVDEAIAQLQIVDGELEKCGPCRSRIGDAYQKKGDHAAAEKAYLSAIEFDPKLVEAYAGLATLYNSMQRFADATKMSEKANELAGASGAASPETVYNQGVIYWNQGKAAEALVQFKRAIELNPKMADAHYWYGMSLVNQGKLPDARKAFEEYLKLEPKGQHAAMAKAILDSIK